MVDLKPPNLHSWLVQNREQGCYKIWLNSRGQCHAAVLLSYIVEPGIYMIMLVRRRGAADDGAYCTQRRARHRTSASARRGASGGCSVRNSSESFFTSISLLPRVEFWVLARTKSFAELPLFYDAIKTRELIYVPYM